MVVVPDAESQYVYVVGPTATGKSQFAIELANELNCPILNCDSVQVYRNVKIGTAQPTPEELRQAPHFLFGYVSAPHTLTAADFLNDVAKTIEQENIKNCIFAGGSGFYIQALQKGLYPQSEASREVVDEVEQIFRTQGPEFIYQWVSQKDPEYAKKLSVNDHYRLKRVMEVMKTQNLNMTDLKLKMAQENHSPLPTHQTVKIGFDDERSNLRHRVEARTEKMLAAGWVEEVVALQKKGLSEWAPMKSVGYKEVQQFLSGDIPLPSLQERIVTATMQLIKKQQTWFKRDPDIRWFKPEQRQEALSWALQKAGS